MIKKCPKCHKQFEPIHKEHEFCPECWNKIYREIHPEKSSFHRICKNPGCNKIIDDQPEGFQYCTSCWVKLKEQNK